MKPPISICQVFRIFICQQGWAFLLLLLLWSGAAAQMLGDTWDKRDLPADDRRARILAMREKMTDPRAREYGFRHDRTDSAFVEDHWNVDLVSRTDSPVPQDIVVKDGIAYVAGAGFLTTLDVSDPAQPKLITNFEMPDGCSLLDLAYPYLYVIAGRQLQVLDISHPDRPVVIAKLVLPDTYDTEVIQVSGQTVIIKARQRVANKLVRLIHLVDVSVPFQPAAVGAIQPAGEVGGFYAAAGHLYVGTLDSTFMIYDIRSPANPVATGFLDLRDWGRVRDIGLIDHYACLMSRDGIMMVDVLAPEAPLRLADYEFPGSQLWRIVIQAPYAYVVDRLLFESFSLIYILDMTFPRAVERLCAYNAPAVLEFFVEASRLYLALSSEGVQVLDVAHPGQPVLAGRYQTLGEVSCVKQVNGLCYLTGAKMGLHIFDTSDAARPIHLGTYKPDSLSLWFVDVQGRYAYAALWDRGFLIIDVADPTRPFLVSFLMTKAVVWSLEVRGDYAYLSDHGGYTIVNIADPARPRIVASDFLFGPGLDIQVVGHYAYVSAGYGGLHILDVSDPAQPVQVGFLGSRGNFWGIAVAGKRVYIADTAFGLRVADVSDPTQPVEIATLEFSRGDPTDIQVAGSYAYIAAGSTGLRVLDISDPVRPVEVGYHETLRDAMQLQWDNGLVYLADLSAGFYILEHKPTAIEDEPDSAAGAQPWLGQNYPNPVAQRTAIPFSLPQAGPVTLSIYNSAGQFVKTLIRKNMPAGRHEVIWNAAGAAAGMYFYQLTSAGRQTVKKLGVIRSF